VVPDLRPMLQNPHEMTGDRVRLTFFGVRGSIPTPVAANLGFGGNTTCLEIQSGNGDRFVIDAGSGVRNLGIERIARGDLDVDLWLTHFHWDHIQGLPFFAPLFVPGARVRFHAPKPASTTRQHLERQFQEPYFPGLDGIAAVQEFLETENKPFKHGGITVHPFELNHPQGACGFRIEAAGAVVVHASDCEHGDPRYDATLRDYAQNADVLIYDAQYTPEDYAAKAGWGHSTWLEATCVARESNVKHLVLFHHDPSRSDAALEAIVESARREFPHTDAAREGWEIRL
jgi:phosphoribosyl 1,2-cyclic phosphodiesterase